MDIFVTQNLEGMHSAMQQLMSRQHKLMLQNNEIIYKQYLEMKIIHLSYLLAGDRHDFSLYKASNNLCLKGYKIIKKWQIIASLVFHKVL